MSKISKSLIGSKQSKKPRFDVPLKPIQQTYKQLVETANSMIEAVLPVLSQHSVTFDSRIANKDLSTCVTSLVSSRILKKFVPNVGTTTSLRDVAIMGFIDYEKDLRARVKDFSLSDSPELWTLRRRCHALLKSYRLDFSDQDIDVGPGETFITSHGYTELIAKLSDRQHWTTTENCRADTHLLCWFNRTLRSAATIHFESLSNIDLGSLQEKYVDHPNPEFAIFCELLDEILIIVPGARISTVPKNNDTDRCINVEALFPMILQRYVAKALLKCLKVNGYAMDGSLKRHKHRHESDRQHIHGWMIKFAKYATIDFSNASDSVVTDVCGALFPQKVIHDLLKYRSDLVVLPNGHTHELYKLSSMGNGFTFETMTCLLLSACRVFTDDCSVFGDDVIIPNEFAESFLNLTKRLGFMPNNKKTFVDAKFRESCGKFYHDDYGYLTSFDIRRCEQYDDVMLVHNKLFLILEEHAEHLNESVAIALKSLVGDLFSLGTASRTGPAPFSNDLKRSNMGLYFYSYDAKKAHMRRKDLRDRYAHHINKLKYVLRDYGFLTDDFNHLQGHNFVVVNCVKITPLRSVKTRHELLLTRIRILTNRQVTEKVRGKNRFSTRLCLVCLDTGRSFPLAALRLEQSRARGLIGAR